MSDDAYDFTTDELLERQVRAAILEKDWTHAKDLMRGKDMPTAFKGSVLNTAVHLGALEMTRFMFEEQRITLAPETAMMFLLDACKEKHMETAFYLCERMTDFGLPRSDPYALLFDQFPAEDSAMLVKGVLATTKDRQDALDNLLLSAAQTARFAVIVRLVDEGADVNAHTRALFDALFRRWPENRDMQPAYDAAIEKCLQGEIEDKYELDFALLMSADRLARDMQSAKTLGALLKAGADPYFRGRAAERLVEIAAPSEVAQALKPLFEQAKADAAACDKRQFETLYGPDYRLADLLQPAEDNGETGLMAAVRAFKLDDVVATAQKNEKPLMTFADVTRKNKRGQSALSLAADRGTLGVLMRPSYWLKQEPQLMQKLQAALTPEEKAVVDFAAIDSEIRQQRLRDKAPAGLRLAPKHG